MTERTIFQPMGRRTASDGGRSLLDLAREAGVELEASCAGKGVCGKCRVKVQGETTPPTRAEREHLGAAVEQGMRLACQCSAPSSATVWVPEESRQQQQVILTTGHELALSFDPALTVCNLEVPPPRLPKVVADRERVVAALASHGVRPEGESWSFPLGVLRWLRGDLQAHQGRLTAVVRPEGQVLDLAPGWGRGCLGLAVDLGTTTVVAYLHDLVTGRPLAVAATMNPQVSHGEDVISRISLCGEDGGLELLGGLARQIVADLARQTCAQIEALTERIFEVVVVGNTAMHHIFLGLPPGGLAEAPYTPVAAEALEVPAAELDLDLAPQARVLWLPCKAGFVGADLVAAALASDLDQVREPTLLVDLGTNGEMALATPEAMVCCSTAAGPAFEGGHVRWGMRGAPGAVDRVLVDPETLEPTWHSIGDRPPLGICGSGLVSLVSQLVAAGAVTPAGSFDPDRAGPHLREGDEGMEYVLVTAYYTATGRDLVLTHKDLSELQLAKAAIHAGVAIMLAELGLERVERVLLAGAFGNYLDPVAACGLGLFPGVTPEMVLGVGNAAGAGAIRALVNRGQRRRAQDLAGRLKYLELAAHPEFKDRFVEGMFFTPGG